MSQKTTRVNGKMITSVLVMAGTAIMGMAYEPQIVPVKAKRAVIAQYLNQKGKYCPIKSEERKRQLLDNIRSIRKQMAAVVITTRKIDRNTTIRPNPVAVKAALRSLENINKLTDSIFA